MFMINLALELIYLTQEIRQSQMIFKKCLHASRDEFRMAAN
jgi:hypothetical protein